MPARTVIEWELKVVDQGARSILRQDRQIRSSLQETDRLQSRLARGAQQRTTSRVRGSQTVARATLSEGRAARQTEADVRRLNRAQAEALGVGNRIAASARRVTDAYRRQGAEARRLSSLERARASASRAGAGLAGAAATGGAGLTRGLQAGLAAAAGGGIAAQGLSIFAGFQQQMSRVQAVSGATRKELGQMTKLAQDLGARTSFSAREAADGMYQLSTAGFKTREVMRTIPGVLDLAAASGTDLASAAELQASAIRAFGLRAGDAGRVADALTTTVNRSAVEMFDLGDSLKYVAPVARATGQSMESMLAAIGLMGNVGVKGSQAGTTLRTALVRLTDPTEKARNALGDLGIRAGELRGPRGLLPLPRILEKITNGAQGVDKGTRNAALAAIFGREALSGMVAMVEAGPGALRKNIDALKHSEGQARRTARTMRDNVAGAWDQFTGSLETAAITLTTRFGPALQRGLSGAAELTNRAAAGGSRLIGGLAAGVRGEDPRRRIIRGPGGRVERVETESTRGAAGIGRAIGGIARTIGTQAAVAGRQLLDAFKPALPFFQNVLLPLLKGVGKGVLLNLVGTFKLIVGAVRIASTALGYLGEKARPLRGVFEGVGTVIGYVFGGPIFVKALSALGRLRGVFGLVGGPARILGRTISGVGGAITGLARGVGRGIQILGSLPARFGRISASIATNTYSALRGGMGKVVDFLLGLGGRFLNAGRKLVDKLVEGLGGIGKRIVGAFRGGLGFAGDIGRALADWLNAHTPLGDHVSLPGPLPDFDMPALRRGGRIRRFAAGGRVPIRAAGGEVLVEGGRGYMIPGDPRRDGTLLMARPGSAVLTSSGQELLAGGADLTTAIAMQAPHFRTGGITPGRYDSTAYGPPWTSPNGTGVTATGVDLRRRPHLYGVAVDPSMIALGQRPYIWPNPFGYTGRFRAFDTGSAIHGRRLDFYDWRGRRRQYGWGHKDVTVSAQRLKRRRGEHGVTYSAPGGRAAEARVRILGASSRRLGLVSDALSQGIAAGEEGLTRAAIRREGNPILQAIREQLAQVGPTGGGLSQRYRREAERGGSSSPSDLRRLENVARSTRAPYVWGGGHGGFSRRPRGLDCSGYASHVIHYGGANPDLAAPVTTDGTARYGRPGRGRRVTLHTRTSSPAHTMLTIEGRGYSSGNRSTGRLSGRNDVSASYLATLPIKRHPAGMRAGGLVAGNLRAPGAGRRLLRGANRAVDFRSGALEDLDNLLGNAVQARMLKLRDAALRAARAGGPQRVVQRLQAIVSEVEFELGRRIGVRLDRVARRSAAGGRAQAGLERRLRREGIDTTSVAGLQRSISFGDTRTVPVAQRNLADLRAALRTARRAGNRSAVRDLSERLRTAEQELYEAVTVQVERRRDLATAIREAALEAAQERVNVTGSGTTLASAGLQRLELEQRLAGTFETGGQARANFIRQTIVPALQAELKALRDQEAELRRNGGTPADIRAAIEAEAAKQNEILQASLDAQQAIEENTEPRAFGGTLGFGFGGENLTDSLVTIGNGV